MVGKKHANGFCNAWDGPIQQWRAQQVVYKHDDVTNTPFPLQESIRVLFR